MQFSLKCFFLAFVVVKYLLVSVRACMARIPRLAVCIPFSFTPLLWWASFCPLVFFPSVPDKHFLFSVVIFAPKHCVSRSSVVLCGHLPPFPVSGRFRACVCVCVFACPRRLYGELCDEWHTGKHAYERSVFFLLYLLSFLGSLLAPHNDDGLCSAVENRVGVEETTSTKSWFVSVVPARRADIRIPCCSFLCSCWTSTLLIHRLFLPPPFRVFVHVHFSSLLFWMLNLLLPLCLRLCV